MWKGAVLCGTSQSYGRLLHSARDVDGKPPEYVGGRGSPRRRPLLVRDVCRYLDYRPSLRPSRLGHSHTICNGYAYPKNSFRSHIQRLTSPQGGDLNRSGLLGKGYFWPQLRSRLTGVSTTDLISNCVERLGLAEQWKPIARFINTPTGSSTSPEFVAVDTVEPSRNRLKVYSRCSATNLSGVVSAMTLGNQPALVNHPGVQHAIANVTHLWRLMFGQDAVDNDVSQISHHSIYTKGVVIYYDLTPGRAIPLPKVYIPVRHYAKNDAHVCEVMSQYYREIGFINSGSTYQETVEKAL